MTIKAVIFDMDGLLLDSERICMDCFVKAGEKIGYPVNVAVYLSCIGTNEESTKAILKNGHGDDFPYEEIRDIWKKLYHVEAIKKQMPVKPGAEKLLQEVVNSNIPVAMATSTRFDHALTKLKNSNLLAYFDFVIGGDQVENGKPDPEIYIKAAEKLAVNPSDCIAFEDSENGVRAAISAGIHVIQIPDIIQPSNELKALGRTIISSFDEFRWHEWDRGNK